MPVYKVDRSMKFEAASSCLGQDGLVAVGEHRILEEGDPFPEVRIRCKAY